ncbi:hypothetical protein [Vibrio scophthalmi]|uniref:Uncharacterized protein n=1 Tax=Vibrio scophthalmi TaxID=45658 RepID=A0A1E3WN80_9VIBR|nr:hypothetical protein [Vibrio scophthalmi]ODS10957.1 hypothetical protein VSF3289_01218 [Vibrio scophthalmi]
MASENKRKIAWLQMLLRESFTSLEIANAVGISQVQCHTTIRHFLSQGIVKEVRGVGVASKPRVLTTVLGQDPKFGSGGGISKKFKKTGRQQLWNNMKIARKFTVESLLSSIDVKQTSAQQYTKSLLDTGYLKLNLTGKTQKGIKNGYNVYTLIRDTGRLAPKLMKEGCWDQNEQKLYPFTKGGNGKAQRVDKEKSNDVA